MRSLVSCLLVLVLALGVALPAGAETEEVVITSGRNADLSGKIIPEGESLEDNAYTQYVYEKTGVRVEYSWLVPSDVAAQKLALAITSGKIPDAILVGESDFQMLYESELLQPLTGLLEEYGSDYVTNSLAGYPDSVAAATRNGELMAIPNTNIGYQHNLTWIRQDWLTKLGLDAPTTLDELIDVAKAFIERDPDGNGVDDTVGITLSSVVMGGYNTAHQANPIAGVFKAYPRRWYQQEDGSTVYGSVTPETRETLAKLAEMYEDGIFDRQFAVRDQNELIASGKCGIMFGPWWMGYNPLRHSFENDGADWVPFAVPLDGEGKFNTTNPVPATSYLVVSRDCEHPEAVIKALSAEYDFQRFLNLDEKWEKRRQEYEELGVTWSIMPFPVQLELPREIPLRGESLPIALETGSTDNLDPFHVVLYNSLVTALESPDEPANWATYTSLIKGIAVVDNDFNTYRSPCFWGTTDIMAKKWATLAKMEDEIFLKIVMGESAIEEFDAFVEQWKKQGGDEITAEIQGIVDARG